jgi:hypothetical protein
MTAHAAHQHTPVMGSHCSAAAAAAQGHAAPAAAAVIQKAAHQQTPVMGSHCSVCGLQLLTAPHATWEAAPAGAAARALDHTLP